MKVGRITFRWKGSEVGQISPIEGDAFFPFVPFREEQPKEERFISAPLENELDKEMLRRIQQDGIKWI